MPEPRKGNGDIALLFYCRFDQLRTFTARSFARLFDAKASLYCIQNFLAYSGHMW